MTEPWLLGIIISAVLAISAALFVLILKFPEVRKACLKWIEWVIRKKLGCNETKKSNKPTGKRK